jgi:3-oxoacyl-[acyl-carrier-protein] synthase III
MMLRFSGKRISSLVTVVPSRELKFEDEIDNFSFSREKSLKLKKIMGFDRRRIAAPETCASDLCLQALNRLLDTGRVRREEIGALILVTQTPDHFIPPTSNLIQGRAGLGQDTFCVDINQGCAGFVVGLIQAFMMLDLGCIRKAVLLNGDTLSHRVGRRDRNIYPMVGDAGSATVIENDPDGKPIFGFLKMDGSCGPALTIPAGGFRKPGTVETAVEKDVGDGNFRSEDQFYMDGPSVFNFVQTAVPPMVDQLLASAGESKDAIDYFLFHQPNKFMLEKLARAMSVPPAKLPNNVVETFGNASSVTIPTNIAQNLGQEIMQRKFRVCLGGFGVGLTWTALLMDLGPMDACELLDYSAPESQPQLS